MQLDRQFARGVAPSGSELRLYLRFLMVECGLERFGEPDKVPARKPYKTSLEAELVLNKVNSALMGWI